MGSFKNLLNIQQPLEKSNEFEDIEQRKNTLFNDDTKNIETILQNCFDAGFEPKLLSGIIDTYRLDHLNDPLLLAFIDDLEVRYVISFDLPGLN
ncbi:hypothetical protein [Paenibacillus sp. sgz500992]|uniref:hypothetical protein n=1 Tax=Paenibacillus sp. sgz500992 TaxID=3242476 RepID=UPI0036D25DFD